MVGIWRFCGLEGNEKALTSSSENYRCTDQFLGLKPSMKRSLSKPLMMILRVHILRSGQAREMYFANKVQETITQ